MTNKTSLRPAPLPGSSPTHRLPATRKAVLATAATLALLGTSLDAQAVALGAIAVRSALGEPLRAEIEIPQISSEEAASFQAGLGSAQAFRAAGVDYSPALSGVRVTLQRRTNGQAYLRILGSRPVDEPILGVVIEASWAGGRIVRDYAVLLDPPGRDALPAVVATQPKVVTAPAAAPRPAMAEQIPAAPGRPAARASTATGGQVTVQKGDTASRIAAANAIDGISLDQMLVAMLQANPKAFIRGNVNLMRAGAVLQMPSAEQAQAITPAAARRTLVAQSRDFHSYRQTLAQNAPAQKAAPDAGRSSGGAVQAEVRDPKVPPKADDGRLVIGPGGGAAGSIAESQAAQTREKQDQLAREAEVKRNIAELEAAAKGTGGGQPATASTTTPGIDVPVATPAPTASAPASAPVVAAAAGASAVDSAAAPGETAAPATATASAPVAATPKPAPAAAPAPVAGSEPSFLDDLLQNPLLPGVGAAIIALLAALGIYRARQRKQQKGAGADGEFSESNLQPDSFFGAEATAGKPEAGKAGASSMSYSPSQLDAAGDVDPVAEADVYLAYGRDKQAEDILKEAMRANPKRISIHRKLAEIYAKRRDARALEAVASEAHGLAQAKDSDWQAIAALGSELDPGNPVYQAGGTPRPKVAPAAADDNRFGPDTEPETAHSSLGARREDPRPSTLDLNLDLSDLATNKTPSSGATPSTLAASTIGPAAAASTLHPHSISSGTPSRLDSQLVDLDLDLEMTPSELPPESVIKAPAADSGMIEFDMQALADEAQAAAETDLPTRQPQSDGAEDDPLSTKLSLALEFRTIGDLDGARTLAQEVANSASGDLKTRAERLLTEL